MEKKFLIPQKSRDVIPKTAMLKARYEKQFAAVFDQHEAVLIDTPLIEFADVFLVDTGGFVAEDLIQMLDENGDLLALRADYTLPIARIVTTKLKDEPYIFQYRGSVFRKERLNNGKNSEVYQMGCEFIGLPGLVAEKKALLTIRDMVQTLDDEVVVEIGDVRFVQRIKQLLELNEIDNAVFEEAICNRNQTLFARLIQKYNWTDKKLALCQRLYGNLNEAELKVFIAQEDDLLLQTLAKELLAYAELLEQEKCSIRINFAMQPKLSYYSGLMIQGYLQGGSEPFLAGGRYDHLYTYFDSEKEAFGFAVNMSECLQRGGR